MQFWRKNILGRMPAVNARRELYNARAALGFPLDCFRNCLDL